MTKIPLTIFTGFLGAGKTTLINSLIDSNPSKKIAVIINEFGEVGIDSDLLKTANEEYKTEISNGCACCVVRGDLQAATEEMVEKFPDLDYIFIEASGLAEPLPIAQTFVHNLTQDKPVFMDSIACVVDAEQFPRNWEQFETLHEQLEYCDFIVLTKASQNPETTARTKEILNEARPEAVLIEFDPSQPKSSEILLDTHSFELTEEMAHEMENEHTHEHNEFQEIVYKSSQLLDPTKLDGVFSSDEFRKLVRAKGFLKLAGQPDKTFVFQLVGHGRQLSESPLQTDENRLVMIGRDLDKAKMIQMIQDAQV